MHDHCNIANDSEAIGSEGPFQHQDSQNNANKDYSPEIRKMFSNRHCDVGGTKEALERHMQRNENVVGISGCSMQMQNMDDHRKRSGMNHSFSI